MGDNILIVHGGGPTSVINASLYGAVKEAKKYKEIDHIYAARNGTGGLMREELIELEKVPDEKLELLLNTPGSAIGTSRDQIEQAEYDRMPRESDIPLPWPGVSRLLPVLRPVLRS